MYSLDHFKLHVTQEVILVWCVIEQLQGGSRHTAYQSERRQSTALYARIDGMNTNPANNKPNKSNHCIRVMLQCCKFYHVVWDRCLSMV